MTHFLSKSKILPICLFCFPNAIPDDPTTTNTQLLALRGKTEEVIYYIDEWVALPHGLRTPREEIVFNVQNSLPTVHYSDVYI